MEDITWSSGYTIFIFECWHEKIKFESQSDHVIFFLFYKIFTIHNDVCGDFPKVSEHFPKIFEDIPKFVQSPGERFHTFFDDFRTFFEDYPI